MSELIASTTASASASASADTSNDKVQLTSKDGESFEVDKTIALYSGLVTTMIGDGESGVEEIPLPNVESKILTKVIEFLTHHDIDPLRTIEKVRTNLS